MKVFKFLPASCLLTIMACRVNDDQRKKKIVEPSTKVSHSREDLGYGPDVGLFSSPKEAIASLVKERPRVIGFGEFHKQIDSASVDSALSRFTKEVADALIAHTTHLVLETWSVDPSCGKRGQAVTKKVQTVIARPNNGQSELQSVVQKFQDKKIAVHLLHFTCSEYNSLLVKKHLQTDTLLTLIASKLAEQTNRALSNTPKEKLIVVYGGATHNDKTPYKGLEDWSYASKLNLPSTDFLEIDLYVPELVQGDELLSKEAWYPILKQARKDKVILIHRDANSYILIMRKQFQAAE